MKSAIILASTAALASTLVQPKPAVCGADGLCNAMHSEPLLWQTIPWLYGWAFARACPPSPTEPESEPAPAQFGCLETVVKVIKKEVFFDE